MIQRLSAVLRLLVLCQVMLLAVSWPTSNAVAQDTTGTPDTLRRVTFSATSNSPAPPVLHGRRIDMAMSAGVGGYSRNSAFPIQGTINADFSARSETINLIGGFHWGFSDPSTQGLSLGLRFPLSESVLGLRGLYADASLLVFDNGEDSGAFQTGLRAALTGRIEPFEARLAAELRKSPFGGDKFEGWAGVEVGFFFGLVTTGYQEPTRKDSLHAALKYIATSQELDDLQGVYGEEELDNWLDRFWQARNVTGTPINDARREYMRRIEIANKRYGTPMTMGVSTDMGRVLLIYGEPDQTETGASIADPARRYTLWIANDRVKSRRTAVFLFLTTEGKSSSGVFAGRGNSREVYSDVPGEPSEGIPYDLPTGMMNYINSFGR